MTGSLSDTQAISCGPVVNLAAYRFVALDDLANRRSRLKTQCSQLQLKGTVLLSEEGINLFVAGNREAIDELLTTLRSDPLLSDLNVKESFSQEQPFRRMHVKIKHEIIPFGVKGIDPRQQTSEKISALELKQWLDEGRPVTLLDTRNDYEIGLGTFQGALPIGISHFRDFPAAVDLLDDHLKQQPVVMFCTGGIRCEKAGPYMEQAGYRNIYQLDGGILKYFEECGNAHYDGDCFVFDQRVALDSKLATTPYVLCFACQQPLDQNDRRSSKYVPGQSCPHCFRTPDQVLTDQIERRHEQIRALTQPLPGSVPYDNHRPVNVPGRYAGLTLLDFLTEWHPHIARQEWQGVIDSGRIIQKSAPVSADRIVNAGERFDHLIPAVVEPDVNADIRILHEDQSLVVVDKPAPLPMHPCGRFNRNSLSYLLNEVYAPQRLRVMHRLDANTSGVVVLCRTRRIARQIQPLFTRRQVEKLYVARVQGHPEEDRFVCRSAVSAQPQKGGLRLIADAADGLAAETHFRVLTRFEDGTSLVESRPVTGRTNQIRVHLWHLGLPVCGDPFYQPNRQTGTAQSSGPGETLCLHARQISFALPDHNEPQVFESELPAWASD